MVKNQVYCFHNKDGSRFINGGNFFGAFNRLEREFTNYPALYRVTSEFEGQTLVDYIFGRSLRNAREVYLSVVQGSDFPRQELRGIGRNIRNIEEIPLRK